LKTCYNGGRNNVGFDGQIVNHLYAEKDALHNPKRNVWSYKQYCQRQLLVMVPSFPKEQ